jgi:hypothetical protein
MLFYTILFYFKTKFLVEVSSDICRVDFWFLLILDLTCPTEFLLPNDSPPCWGIGGLNDNDGDASVSIRFGWRIALGDDWISCSDEPWLLSDVCLLSVCCFCCK